MPYAIKAALDDPDAEHFIFADQKTMYGGKAIAPGDELFIFHSETAGGTGLIAAAIVTAAAAVPRRAGVERQTPRVGIAARRTATAHRVLGRAALRRFSDWRDGRPETELNFKLYRQATDKIVGISDAAAAVLRACLRRPPGAADA